MLCVPFVCVCVCHGGGIDALVYVGGMHNIRVLYQVQYYLSVV